MNPGSDKPYLTGWGGAVGRGKEAVARVQPIGKLCVPKALALDCLLWVMSHQRSSQGRW